MAVAGVIFNAWSSAALPASTQQAVVFVQSLVDTTPEWGNERHHLGGHTCSWSVYTLVRFRFELYCAP